MEDRKRRQDMNLYKVKFTEWHIWGEDEDEAKEKIINLLKDGASPRVTLTPTTLDSYFFSVLTRANTLRKKEEVAA
jgi:hypothetical protein